MSYSSVGGRGDAEGPESRELVFRQRAKVKITIPDGWRESIGETGQGCLFKRQTLYSVKTHKLMNKI